MAQLVLQQQRPTGNSIRTIALALIVAVGAALSSGAGAGAARDVNVNDGYAVHGYDVVAYFTVGRPTEGDDRFVATYQGAAYRFSSSANRDRFAAEPARFSPQYGGFCAFGASVGRKFDGDPKVWRIVGGKLYLNLNKTVQTRWLKNPRGYIRGADHNWSIIAGLIDAELEADPPAGLTLGVI